MSKLLVQPQYPACQGNYPTSSSLLLLEFGSSFVYCVSVQLDVLSFLFVLIIPQQLKQELRFDSVELRTFQFFLILVM